MDVLIDLIIYLIKAAAKSRETSVPRQMARPQPIAPAAPQIQVMQRTLAAQQARTRAASPRPGRGPASWAQPGVRAAVPPVNQPEVAPIIANADLPLRPARSASPGISGLKLPFLLGEVLSHPVSLRPEAHGGLSD